MPNTFPARERQFISALADDLHLSLTWDEYDENDQNIVIWRFPDAVEPSLLPEVEEVRETNGDVEGDGEWEDVDDDDDDVGEEEEEEEEEESKAAVDRVLKKYGKAQVMDDDEGGGFDARYERSLKEKMDEWKRGYYKVRFFLLSHIRACIDAACVAFRANLRYRTTVQKRWATSYSVMWRVYNG